MSVTAQFQDRAEAGRFLATKLAHHSNDPALIVLALPRGGVPVGYEIATALDGPLDVFIVQKLAMPGYEELSVGTVASGGVRILNSEAIHHLSVSENLIDALVQERARDLERQEKVYRAERPPLGIEGRNVILVDDGLATGANMRLAVRALRERHPKSVILAVPIGSADTCHQMRDEADEVICGMTPDPFYSVGTWYCDFMQITDEEARELLDHAAHERRAKQARRNNRYQKAQMAS